MLVLFLDDSQSRHDFVCFKPHTQRWSLHVCSSNKYTVYHVYTAQQAITQIDLQCFDVISLDHDLTINKPDANNGWLVAAHLASVDSLNRRARVLVHSWNYAAASRMHKHLAHANYDCCVAPFPIA